ncbi:regulatory protein GemA [Lichenibacterium ramalinae]|uniref:Regulatory protein GemA n=1 Tax=Lichenibacterium ramalinae TaxID=2316527 RepID=A0A4V1RI22_9HYPH|nr:regulatory protein GemA [Lichenibacterium ramalinae]RYB02037.1 regulatory protein GemA [Lichenibacterium ramalinae]
MIRALHLKVVEQACATLAIDTAARHGLLQRWGRVQRLEDLKVGGYQRLVDHFILQGFRTRHRPILSADTRDLIGKAYSDRGLSKFVLDTDLRRQGVADIRDLDGQCLLDLMALMEVRGIDIERFKAERRTIKPGQLKTLGMARKVTEISDFSYYRLIQRYSGVNSASDLDDRGYELSILCLEGMGFSTPGLDTTDPGLAGRPGFASPRQVALVQTLWAEWAGNTDAAALNAWLERYYRVSALRFLSAANASKAITALKAMKSRATEPSKVTA